MPCFAQVSVASENNEPEAEEAQHCQGGEEGDDQAGDQGALHMGHTSCYQVWGSAPGAGGRGWCRQPPAQSGIPLPAAVGG